MSVIRNYIECIKNPREAKNLARALLHERLVRFHTDMEFETAYTTINANRFLDWVAKILPPKKHSLFCHYFKLPVTTTELTSEIYQELYRVWDGRNTSQNFQFYDSKDEDDYIYYRTQKINLIRRLRSEGWERIKSKINSLVVIDLPQEQSGDLPEPYFYFVDIENVRDIEVIDGVINWVIFKPEKNHFVVIDEEAYRIYKLDEIEKEAAKKGEFVNDYKLEYESFHGLGYCPVTFLWGIQNTIGDNITRRSLITKELNSLDWFLFWDISNRISDTTGAFPVWSVYEESCDYQEFINEDDRQIVLSCHNGLLRTQGKYHFEHGAIKKCPRCAEANFTGAGSVIKIQPTRNKDEYQTPLKAAEVVTVEPASLEYVSNKRDTLRDNIKKSVVGIGGDILDRQQINATQAESSFSSKTNILLNIASQIEAVIKFIDKTVCKLRYESGFITSSTSLGTEFYIYSVEDLYKKSQEAQKAGASQSELDAIKRQIIETEYHSNPALLERLSILTQLEPYRDLTIYDVIESYDKGILNKQLCRIKINFNNFVDRFERENINIVEFGSNLELSKKCDIILNEFKKYDNEERENEETTKEKVSTENISQTNKEEAKEEYKEDGENLEEQNEDKVLNR